MFDSEYLLETVARNRRKKTEGLEPKSKLLIDIEKACRNHLGTESQRLDTGASFLSAKPFKNKQLWSKPCSPASPSPHDNDLQVLAPLRRSSNSIKFTKAIKERLAAFNSARSLKALPPKNSKTNSSQGSHIGQTDNYSIPHLCSVPDLQSKTAAFKDSSLGSKSISKKGSNLSGGGFSYKSFNSKNSGSFDQSRELEKKLNLSTQANKSEFEMFKQSLKIESTNLDLFAEIKSSHRLGVDCIDDEIQYVEALEKNKEITMPAPVDAKLPIKEDSREEKIGLSLIEEASHFHEQTPNNVLSPSNRNKILENEEFDVNFTLERDLDKVPAASNQREASSDHLTQQAKLKTFIYKLHSSRWPQQPADDHGDSGIKSNQIVYEDDSRYVGNIEDGKRHGFGHLVLPDGSRLEGDWKNDVLEGEGRLFYSSGKLAYEGSFKEGQFHGHGVMYSEQFDQRQGNAKSFSGDRIQSVKSQTDHRVLDYQNLNATFEEWMTFEGCFELDVKSGIGIMEMSNGDVFMGEFLNDKANGPGSYQTARGVKFLGIWRENYLVYELMLPAGLQTDKTKLTF